MTNANSIESCTNCLKLNMVFCKMPCPGLLGLTNLIFGRGNRESTQREIYFYGQLLGTLNQPIEKCPVVIGEKTVEQMWPKNAVTQVDKGMLVQTIVQDIESARIDQITSSNSLVRF